MPEEKEIPKKKQTKTYGARILAALARVYENDNAELKDVLQAARLSSEILERRPKIHRKTEKEKMIDKALNRKTRPFGPIKKAIPKDGQ